MITMRDLLDRPNYVELQPGDEGFQGPPVQGPPLPPPQTQSAPNPAGSLRQQWFAHVHGQNPYVAEQVIQNQKAHRAATMAQTEMNFQKAYDATPPKSARRKAAVQAQKRWYQTMGIPVPKDFEDFVVQADQEDFEDMAIANQIMRQQFPEMDPEGILKMRFNNPQAEAKYWAALAEAQERRAKIKKLEAEGKAKEMEGRLLEGALSRSGGLQESPGEAPSPGPSPVPQRAPGGSQGPQMRPASQPVSIDPALQNFVVQRAKSLGVDPALAQALIHQESGWNPQATSPTGVQGVAQVTNATGAQYGQTPQTRTNPYISANTGLTYLADLLKQTGNEDEALRRYNGGSDPQFVQNVRRHLPLYKPSSMAVAEGANDQERAVIQKHRQEMDKIDEALRRFPAEVAISPRLKAIRDELQTDFKRHQDAIKSIEDRYDKNKPDEDTLGAAGELFDKPWTSLSSQERQAARQYGPVWRARKAATVARATAEAEEPSRIRVAAAGREGQTVKDVTEFEDAQGNPPPVGLTYGELKESGKYKQVKHLTDKQIEESETRREFVLNLRDLKENHKAIATGPVAGRLERWGQALGTKVESEQVAQRLLLEKINNDAAFLRGGKALTANEIRRIQAELPQDTDPAPVFQAKLDKALKIAERYARNRTTDLKALGYKVPPSLGIDGDSEVTEFINLLKQGTK